MQLLPKLTSCELTVSHCPASPTVGLHVVVDALFVVTNFGGTMNNVSPAFAIPDHLQYCVCRQIGPVYNVVDPGTWWSSSASAAWDTACDDVLF